MGPEEVLGVWLAVVCVGGGREWLGQGGWQKREERWMEWRSIEEGKPVGLGDIWMWEVKDREVSRMTPGFLAFVTGWVVVPDPERGKAGARG